MGSAIGNIIPSAAGVAISPLPIAAVILILFTPAARRNGIAFAIAWAVTLAAICGVTIWLSGERSVGSNDGASDVASLIQLLLGIGLLLLAVREWRARPAPGADPPEPGWMDRLESMQPQQAAGLAALLSGVNPKNLMLTVAAALSISRAELTSGQDVIVLLIFVAIASVSVAGAVLYQLWAGERASHQLESLKAWFIANNATIIAVILVLLGAKLIGDAIAGFSM